MMVGIGKRPAANYKFDPLPLALAQAGSYCTDIWKEKKRTDSRGSKATELNLKFLRLTLHWSMRFYRIYHHSMLDIQNNCLDTDIG